MKRREFTARRELCPAGSARADEVFARVGAGVLTWGIQRGAGFDVVPDTPVALDGVHDVVIGWRGHGLRAPVRVVEVFRSDQRIGFTYATMPGHPENGEETFVVERRADGGVEFVVRAHSRPGTWWVRLGSPVARLAQDVATRRYLAAAARLAV